MAQPLPKDACNKLCRACVRHCRQPQNVLLLECPRFLKRPFKSPDYKFNQLDLFE